VHKVFCFVIVGYNKPIIFVNSNNRLVFIMEAQCVFDETELYYSIVCSLIRVTFVFRGVGVGMRVGIICFILFLKCFFSSYSFHVITSIYSLASGFLL